MTPEVSSEKISRLVAAGTRLAIDAGTAELIERLERVGVRALLLKGASVARWLYPNGTGRSYDDCDLLVGPLDFATAEHVLRSAGFTGLLAEMGMPSWWCEHATVWRRRSDGLCVDLHRTLVGVCVDDATTWRVLSTEPDEIVVAGRRVPVLGLPARALHVALHAAQHGHRWGPWITDVERALAVGDDQLWWSAVALAIALEATPAFVAGLSLVPAGEQVIARLALQHARSPETELRVSSPPPLALGFEQLAQASGMRARAEIARRKLAPTPAFLRDWDPHVGDGRLDLVRAYIRRALWLLRHAPRGLHAWYRVRRSAGRGTR
jgi:hypothetical protein